MIVLLVVVSIVLVVGIVKDHPGVAPDLIPKKICPPHKWEETLGFEGMPGNLRCSLCKKTPAIIGKEF